MATFSKIPLSGSTNGKGIAVAATATPGTLIHTAVTGTAAYDEVWLYVVNTSASDVKLTLEYGGTATSDLIEYTVTAEDGLAVLVPGLFLNNAQVIRAFAATGSVLNIHGYVHRVS